MEAPVKLFSLSHSGLRDPIAVRILKSAQTVCAKFLSHSCCQRQKRKNTVRFCVPARAMSGHQ